MNKFKRLADLSISLKLALIAFLIIALAMAAMTWAVNRAATHILDDKALSAMKTQLSLSKSVLAAVDRQARVDLEAAMGQVEERLNQVATRDGGVLALRDNIDLQWLDFSL
jgi:hypothetical protein